jgi:hypothetical protein
METRKLYQDSFLFKNKVVIATVRNSLFIKQTFVDLTIFVQLCYIFGDHLFHPHNKKQKNCNSIIIHVQFE